MHGGSNPPTSTKNKNHLIKDGFYFLWRLETFGKCFVGGFEKLSVMCEKFISNTSERYTGPVRIESCYSESDPRR